MKELRCLLESIISLCEKNGIFLSAHITQPAFTCLKLTIETLEQGVNMFKVNNKDTRTTPLSQKGLL